jgi:dihydroneopterin aldolase
MDVIRVSGLVVSTHVGVPESERSRAQDVSLDIELEVDLVAAAASDDLADSVDYGKVTKEIADLVAGMSVALLERIAGEVADHVLGFKGVERATVEVSKLHPPVDQEVSAIAVKIERGRHA